jgi:hypothetical protein
MKKIYQLLVLLFAVIITGTSCKKLLEPKIYGKVNSDDFPKTEADVKSALIPFYAQFNTNYGSTDISNGVFDFSLTASFLGYTWATSTQTDENFDLYYFPYSQFTLGPGTYLNNSGFSFYDRVSYIAKLTGLIDKVEKSSINQKVLYLAEAKGLRAWLMYVLYDLYGPVSVKLDAATLTNNEIIARPSKEIYTAAIETDLLAAIAGLPNKYNGTNDWGRLSKGVARMILLKLYMHDKKWDKAKTVGTDLMGMGYTLNPSYKNVFVTAQNSEVIFAVPGSTATTSIWYACILPGDAKFVLGNDVTSGDKYKLNAMPWAFYDKYSIGDTRLQTIANSYINNSGQTITRAGGLDAAIPMKYTSYVSNGFGFDYVIYRYADVLLSMAEITNELAGPTAEAQGYLIQVTNRANTTATIPAGAFASTGAMRSFILEERGRELYWEFGIRRQDLIRNGTFISNANARGNSTAKSHQVLFPIPADVIIQSGGIITQNAGY